ncbi:MAG TPA: alpha/beta fold hydrolase, partial [Longimicrobiales bacterium]|nr:alpha/beta fold hydrolase [Longimicrobiales bacterium]
YGPEDHAALVGQLLEARDLRRVTLVGHSLGGGIALLAALADVETGAGRIERLVLVGSAAYPQKLPPFVALAGHPRIMRMLFRVLGARLIVGTVLRAIVHDPGTVDAEQVRGYAQPLGSPEAIGALVATARQIQPPGLDEITARYRRIDLPVLLLWGRHDRVVPLAVGERLAAELPRAHLHVLAACGHVPPEELPDASYAVLEAFLDGRLEAA